MGEDRGRLEYSQLAEADHRIANHLALVAGFVRVKAGDLAKQSAEPSRASVTALFESIGVQLDAVARLHRSLATNREQPSTNLPELLHAICAPFRSGLSGKESRPQESGQDDKWSFCLTAGTL